MPIRPEHRRLYPFDWRELSASVRFRRAKGHCERCGRPHGKLVVHLGDGRWWDTESGAWRDAKGRRLQKPPTLPAWPAELPRTRVILACAHLDHDPTNNAVVDGFIDRVHSRGRGSSSFGHKPSPHSGQLLRVNCSW